MTNTTDPATTDTTRAVLRAEGFSCPSCIGKIDKQLRRLPGVRDVEVAFASARITIEHDPDLVSVDELVAAVAKAGFRARPSAF